MKPWFSGLIPLAILAAAISLIIPPQAGPRGHFGIYIPETTFKHASTMSIDDPRQFQDCRQKHDAIEQLACRIGLAAMGDRDVAAREGYNILHLSPKDQIAAWMSLETMNLVQQLFSPSRSAGAYWEFERPVPQTISECIAEWTGICGNQVAIFREILGRLGVSTRPIEFYYSTSKSRQSHIGAEVYYATGWHYFDVTWGTVFPTEQALVFRSVEELIGRPLFERQSNGANPWFELNRRVFGDPLAYLNAKDLSYLIDHNGTIAFTSSEHLPFTEKFMDLPNYIGDAVAGQPASVRLVTNLPRAARISLSIGGIGGCKGAANLLVNERKMPLTAKTIVIEVAAGKLSLDLETDDDICYVVLNQLNAEPLM